MQNSVMGKTIYKKTGISWLPEMPKHWGESPLWVLFGEKKDKNKGNLVPNVLSLSYGNIVRRDLSGNVGLLPASFETYQIVNSGDLVLRLTDLQNDKKSFRVGFVKEKGVITSAYTVLKAKGPGLSLGFYYYSLHALDLIKYFYGLGGGVRQSAGYKELKWLKLPVPPLAEQRAIARCLDDKTGKIDRFVGLKVRLVSSLKAYRQAIVGRAVTRGLRPGAALKDSGTEWLGQIPEHWEVRRLKYCVSLNSNAAPPRNDDKHYRKIALENLDNWTGRYIKTAIPGFEGRGSFFKKGDVLFSKLRPYLAKAYLAIEEGFCVGELLVLTPDREYFTSGFLFQRLMATDFIESVNGSTYGVKMPRASWNFIGSIKLAIPPLAEQKEIARYLTDKTGKIDSLIACTETKIRLMKAYKGALISGAVSGKNISL